MSLGELNLLRNASESLVLCNDNVSPLDQLPDEVLLRIFRHIDEPHLLLCGQICRRWRAISTDWHLWRVKLLNTLERNCRTIECLHQPLSAPSFRDLSAIHPRELFIFLSPYILKSRFENSESPSLEYEKVYSIDENDNDVDTNLFDGTQRLRSSLWESRRFPFFDHISHWWDYLKSFYQFRSRSSLATSWRPRFALFGPGFDHRDTSSLFRKMVDVRTKSFEPIDMFTELNGFGSGITLRLFSQAQRASMDSSLCPLCNDGLISQKYSRIVSYPSHSHLFRPLRSNHLRQSYRNLTSTSTTIKTRSLPIISQHPHLDTNHIKICYPKLNYFQHQYEDFTFDLSYLYSLPAHLNHRFTDQLSRLSVSRLFLHTPNIDQESSNQILQNMTVTKEMKDICANLDGVIYAVDARASPDQLSYLFFELVAVLRGFRPEVASHIPVVILYIMPERDIKLTKPINHEPCAKFDPQLPNRDSYSGADYTAAWHDSLLLPVFSLRLFELSNPWRLQKCSSNDIKCLIKGIMWLTMISRLRLCDNS